MLYKIDHRYLSLSIIAPISSLSLDIFPLFCLSFYLLFLISRYLSLIISISSLSPSVFLCSALSFVYFSLISLSLDMLLFLCTFSLDIFHVSFSFCYYIQKIISKKLLFSSPSHSVFLCSVVSLFSF